MRTIDERIYEIGIIPVVKLADPENNAKHLANALIKGDVNVIEITFRADGADTAIRIIKNAYPNMLVGAGTVLSIDQVDKAIKSGADFIVSPGFDPELVDYCCQKEICIYPGCATATEYQMALKRNLEVIKFFPAEENGGLKKIKALSGPFPMFKVMPTGGITLKNLDEYISFENVIACGGTFMVNQDSIKNKKWDDITQNCLKARKIIKNCRNF